MKKLIVYAGLFLVVTAAAVKAQVAAGGIYRLEQSVIAAGGGTSSNAGNTYTVGSTIGEPVAGTTSSSPAYTLRGGFRVAAALAPTAAPVWVGGQVLTPDGSGLRNARVTLTDTHGNVRSTVSGKLGYFRFSEIPAGETYVVRIVSRRYVFQTQVVFAGENLNNLVFTANGQTGGGILQP